MLIYPSPRCIVEAAHLCDGCWVEYILPHSLDVVMTNWETYKKVLAP